MPERRNRCIKKNGNGVPVRSRPTGTLGGTWTKATLQLSVNDAANLAAEISIITQELYDAPMPRVL